MDIDDLATRLWSARRDGMDAEVRPDDVLLTNDEAYRLQHNYVRISGQARTGWKVAATNAPMQENLGLSEPFAGPLLEDFTLQSPATCALVAHQAAIVEVEFVFRMGVDFVPKQLDSIDALCDAVDAVCAGIEVAGTRFPESMGRPSTPLVIADASANIALVHGEPMLAWRDFDLAEHEAQLRLNGEIVDGGAGNKVLGNPLNSLAWLAAFLDRQGLSLKRGDLITTGTVTDMRPVEVGDEVGADFGALGEAKVAFVSATD